MNVKLEGASGFLHAGVAELKDSYGCSFVKKDGLPVHVTQWDRNELKVTFDGRKGAIFYHEPIHFFRAMGLLLEMAAHKESFTIEETPQFTMNGIMLDCSRNAVMQPEQIKALIRTMAVMGLNMLMLYMEDTYEIEEQPYFGYRRGRYSKHELKELDDYAHQFGIEIIPSIQTLAHLSTFLRWDVNAPIRDTSDILLAGSTDTYRLIDQMISSVMQPFRTKRIHIGMDEAHLLGKGQYEKKNGHRASFDIMNEHLHEVLNITRSYGLHPMVWSDMYFRMASDDGEYYDPQAHIPEEVIDDMPKDVRFVYWDYYHEEEGFYRSFLQKHHTFGRAPIFASGIWTWNGVSINYPKTFHVIQSSYQACKKEGIQEVFATLWGDDGAETHPFQALLGLQLIAEHGYSLEVDMEKVNRRFAFCTGAEMKAFLTLGTLDQPPGSVEGELEPANPSKYLLWQDPLVVLFAPQEEDGSWSIYYETLFHELDDLKKHAGQWAWIFDVPCQMCNVLRLKVEWTERLKKAYEQKDFPALQLLHGTFLPKVKEEIQQLRERHYEQWMRTNKPFGWEVLDLRYGGLIARFQTAERRLSDYVQGRIDDIPELDEKRLPFSEPTNNGWVRCNVYRNIASANPL